MKTLLLILLAVIITISSGSFSDTNQTSETQLLNDHLKTIIENYFNQPGWTNYYKLIEIKVDLHTHIDKQQFTSNVFVNIKRDMLFDSVQDSPFIQGLYASLNLRPEMGKDNIKIALASNNELNEKQKLAAMDLIESYESDLTDSIANTQERFYEFKITGYLESVPIIQSFTFESVGSHDPNSIVPEVPEISYLSGQYAMRNQLAQFSGNQSETSILSESLYNRYNAYTYANRYTSNPTTCSYHGTSCSILQNTASYNTAYNAYAHNDCANYVSQALKAGGLGTNTSWKPYTYAWIRVSNLKSYLSNNGLLQTVSFSTIVSGGIMFTGESHVMMVVKKDGTESLYSAHSNDRRMYPFSNYSSWSYYNIK